MKETLITYKTALLAKERGFNTIVDQMYSSQIIPQLEPYSVIKFTLYHHYCLAPTQGLLQKWIRDVHNIHIEISHWTEQPIEEIIWPHCFQALVEGHGVNIYPTYEEALEEALVSALNLIPEE